MKRRRSAAAFAPLILFFACLIGEKAQDNPLHFCPVICPFFVRYLSVKTMKNCKKR